MSEKSDRSSSIRRKKISRGEESPPSKLLIVNMSFEDNVFSVPVQTRAQEGGTVQLEAKQKVVAKKNASPPSKRRKFPILDEEAVDKTLVKSPKSSPIRLVVPSKVKITDLVDISLVKNKKN